MSRLARRTSTALVTACALGAGIVPSAPAAPYTVQLCHQSSGFSADGAVPVTQGNYVTASTCGQPNPSLFGLLHDGVEHAPGDSAWVTIHAPSGTSLTRLDARRVAAAGPSRPYGTPVVQLFTTPGGAKELFSALPEHTPSANGQAGYDLGGASSVTWGASCTGTAGCPVGASYFTLYDLVLRLEDSGIPSVTDVAGTLRSSTTTTRHRSLTYTATDAGSGVFRQRLIIDGVTRAAETVHDNGGLCGAPFTARVPCRKELTGTVSLDTATLPDGSHELALDVRDATDDNRRIEGPWAILVDNQPPVVGAITLTGTAREGDTLTCGAPVSGQSATIGFQWLRTQADGSAPEAIPGATNPAYALVAADAGRKLVCRIVARDAGGTTTRESTITQVPFDQGRTVATYCSGRPTGPRDECGDLDGDGIVNRLDPDIDGDGMANEADSDPYDASRPGPSTPGGGSGDGDGTGGGAPAVGQSGPAGTGGAAGAAGAAGAPGAPGPAGAAAVAPVGAAGTVRFALAAGSTTGPAARARWSRSAFVLRGRLTDPEGRPVPGVRLTLTQAVRSTPRDLAAVTTASDGSWAFRVPRGPSRTVTVRAGDSTTPATVSVRQTVIAQVEFRSLKKRIRRGGAVSFRGRLRGGYTNSREKLVEFQVHYRGAWRSIATLHARGGTFAVRYRFGRAARGTFRFRARTLPTDGYPFAPAASPWRNATVKVG